MRPQYLLTGKARQALDDELARILFAGSTGSTSSVTRPETAAHLHSPGPF